MANKLLNALFLAATISMFTTGAAAQDPHDHSQDQNTQDQTKPGMSMAMMQSCAMSLQGVDLQISDTSDGIRVVTTTKSGDVAELRRRVEAMAKMHSDPSKGPMMQGKMMAFTVKYDEVSKGARLTLTPKDHAQLSEFRTEVRKHAELMKKGDCSMMQGMMDGKKNSESTPKPEDSDHSDHHPSADGK